MNTDAVEAVECMKSWRKAGLMEGLSSLMRKIVREEIDESEIAIGDGEI